jgi:hypothetical protein
VELAGKTFEVGDSQNQDSEGFVMHLEVSKLREF